MRCRRDQLIERVSVAASVKELPASAHRIVTAAPPRVLKPSGARTCRFVPASGPLPVRLKSSRQSAAVQNHRRLRRVKGLAGLRRTGYSVSRSTALPFFLTRISSVARSYRARSEPLRGLPRRAKTSRNCSGSSPYRWASQDRSSREITGPAVERGSTHRPGRRRPDAERGKDQRELYCSVPRVRHRERGRAAVFSPRHLEFGSDGVPWRPACRARPDPVPRRSFEVRVARRLVARRFRCRQRSRDGVRAVACRKDQPRTAPVERAVPGRRVRLIHGLAPIQRDRVERGLAV